MTFELQNAQELQSEILAKKKEEFIMLSFRLKDGVDLKRYNELFSTSFLEEKKKAIEKNREFLNISFNNISIKEEYMFIYDSIVSDFF